MSSDPAPRPASAPPAEPPPIADDSPISLRILDVYRIGPGPSSSHTVGPMRAAGMFRRNAGARGVVPTRLRVVLHGSLSATGRGHGTDRAVLAGLAGWHPETVDPDAFLALPDRLASDPWIEWENGERVRLRPDDVEFAPRPGLEARELPHANTLDLEAIGSDGEVLFAERWCSIGGGFVQRVADEDGIDHVYAGRGLRVPAAGFRDGKSLLAQAERLGSVGAVVLANEAAWEDHPGEVAEGLDRVWDAFRACIQRGIKIRGELPGGLGVRRRAPELWDRLEAGKVEASWADVARGQAYAYAINEENAAGGMVVTAPTNGAAGIFPGTLVAAAERHQLDRAAIHRAMATGAAIAMVIKTHASLSGAEVGCQGEVGSATAMAAAALCEILGGTPQQVCQAAEIGLEHNLGLTCDPIKGLVQAPCIERNAMGVAKAWSAAQLALHSDGPGVVSLDKVIRVMKRTGDDMRREYKETSEGGLAVTIPEC
jgi:L-serine dehydratase